MNTQYSLPLTNRNPSRRMQQMLRLAFCATLALLSTGLTGCGGVDRRDDRRDYRDDRRDYRQEGRDVRQDARRSY